MAGDGEADDHSLDDLVTRATSHFPTRRREIARLAEVSERFRELCEELAVAEGALATVDQVPSRLQAERRLEWLSYVRDTLAALDVELRSFNVVSLERPSREKL